MNLSTIEMPKTEARKAFLDYKRAVAERHDDEDAAIMRGYRELARGKQLISLNDTIAAGGQHPDGTPKLAVVRADSEWCWLNVSTDGEVVFDGIEPTWQRRSHARRTRIPAGILAPPPGCDIGRCRQWHSDSNKHTSLRHRIEGVRAMVPIVPPALRPAHHLRNYHILWEVEKWEKAPRPPGDPALLKHIGGDLYAVLAVWDLTPLERLVLQGRNR